MPHEPQDDPNQNTLPVEEVRKLVEANEQWATNRGAEPLRLREECRTLAEKNSTVSSIGDTGYLDHLEETLAKKYTPRTENLQAKLLGDPVPYPELDDSHLDAPAAPSVPAGEVPKPTATEAVEPALAPANEFVRKGDTWQISMNGDTCSVPHRVGMTYIAELLLQPNQPINAITLLTPPSSAPDLDPRVHSKIAREDMPGYDDEDEDSARTDCTSLGPDGEVLLHDHKSSAFLKKRALELKEAIEEKRRLGQDCGEELADLESITEYVLSGTWHGKIKSFRRRPARMPVRRSKGPSRKSGRSAQPLLTISKRTSN